MATKAAAKKKSVRTPSGRKRARQSIKANAANTALRSRFRTAVKSVRKAIAAGDHAKAMEVFKANAPVLDSIDLEAQLACCFLRGVERHFVGHAHAVRVARAHALFAQLRLDLRAEAMHEHDAHAHGGEQGDILHQGVESSGRDQFAGDGDHKSLAAMGMDVGCDGTQPIDELFLLGDHAAIIRE